MRKAVELNDFGLVYDEPWGWMHPARHVLGALLLEQGHVIEAEEVYRQDLGISKSGKNAKCCHPNNIWSLRGLEECFAQMKQLTKLKETAGNQYVIPDDYEEIMQSLEKAAKICEGPTVISCSCACKQSWNS